MVTLNFGKEMKYNLSQIKREEKLCGTMPSKVENAKEYTFDCEAIGDYVKIVTGRNEIDQKLTFANVEVYGTNQADKIDRKSVV